MIAAVYRYFDADGALLYIGASSWPIDRVAQHAWGRGDAIRQVVRVEMEWFDTRAEAWVAEAAAIKAENPPWNIACRVQNDNLEPRRRRSSGI